MKISIHVTVSCVLAAILYPFYGWKVLLVFAGGVLIDADHYWYYAAKYRKLNLVDCYNFFSSEADNTNHVHVKGIVLALHTVEFLAIMLALSFYSEYALMFTVGLVGHYILDAIWFISVLGKFVLNHSIIWWIVKRFKSFK